MGVEDDEGDGVLKLHSKILESYQLKKLDKSEKSLVNAIHLTGKGKEIPLLLVHSGIKKMCKFRIMVNSNKSFLNIIY